MKLKNVLIVVDDIEESIRFYKDLFGLQVILKQEGNVILSEGLVLQDAKLWNDTIDEPTTPYNNMTELYFEDDDIEGIVSRIAANNFSARYVTELTELENGLDFMIQLEIL